MNTKLCLFDDFYIAARPGTVRRYFSPERLGYFNDPEHDLQTYTTFFYDESVGKFRLYYEVPYTSSKTEIRKLILAEGETVEDFLNGNVQKTEVTGLCEHGVHGCSVLRREHPQAPDMAYLLVGNFHVDDRTTRRMFTARSEDGIHFTNMTAISEDYSDTYNSLYYNSYTEEYVVTMRGAIFDRRIAIIRSKDFVNWSNPEVILHPLADGNRGVQYYAMGANESDGMFYGLLWRFMVDLSLPEFTDMFGYMENDLYYSYDGLHFMPTGLSPVCQRPLPPELGCKQLWLSNICDDRQGRTILCGGASNLFHGGSGSFLIKTAFYGIRKDGFCALEGFDPSSIVYTKRFLLDSDCGELKLNFNACLGRLSVAVLDDRGQPMEGYSFEDCVSFAGEESVDGTVCWKQARLADLGGKRVRFAIRLDGALLYSLRFDGRPSARLPQISFGDVRALQPIDYSFL